MEKRKGNFHGAAEIDPTSGNAPDAVRPPDAQELTLAVGFMEAAIAAGTEPELFAMGAKEAIPP